MTPTRLRTLICTPGLAAVLSIAATAHCSETEDPYTVAPIDLTITVSADGRLESADRRKIRFAPEAFSGSLKVVEVVKADGRVAAGEVLVRLEEEKLSKALRSARESLADARRAMKNAELEAPMILESGAVALQRARWNHMSAQHAWDVWKEHESRHMLKNAELGLQSREFSLADQREELEQLEKMYEGAKLAVETREIVLDRARRSVKMSEEYLAIARDNLQITRDVRHPDRHRELEQSLQWAQIDLNHTELKASLAESKAAAMTDNAERALRDAIERVEKLERDQKLRTITAPMSGVITPIDLKPGDKVSAGAVITEVLDPSQFVVSFDIGEADLRVIDAGVPVTIAFPSFGELEQSSAVQTVSPIGAASGDSKTEFECVAPIQRGDAILRPGLRCTVRAEKALKKVLAVPKSAVKSENGKYFCTVRATDGHERDVRVRLGASNDEMIQIVDGISAGDIVVLDIKSNSEE